MSSAVDFYTEQLAPLVDGKVDKILSDEDGFIGLKIVSGKKEYVVWFLSDDEGNSPGSFEINQYESL